MRIETTCTGLDLTDALRDYATSKLAHLEKFAPTGHELVVALELERESAHHHKGEVYRAEVNIKVDGRLLRAEARASDLYAAIDLVKDEAQMKLTNYKTRQVSLARRGARALKNIFRKEK